MNSWNQWGILLDQVALVDKTGAFISPGSPNSNSRKMKKQSQSKTQLLKCQVKNGILNTLFLWLRFCRYLPYYNLTDIKKRSIRCPWNITDLLRKGCVIVEMIRVPPLGTNCHWTVFWLYLMIRAFVMHVFNNILWKLA